MGNDFYVRDTCRLCGSLELTSVLSLPDTPPGNQFLDKSTQGYEERKYPLSVMFCESCYHMQLSVVVSPSILFRRDYKYVTGVSPSFVQHFIDYENWVTSKFIIEKGDLVVDIGSNDGTCLMPFKSSGYRVLGVDPASHIAAKATSEGIPTIDAFFNVETAQEIVDISGKAKLVTSHNACAHIDDLDSVISGVKLLLDTDGLFVMEVGYAVDVIGKGLFDTIYHEHLDFHTLGPLIPFFNRHGMEAVCAYRNEIQGGTLRVVAMHLGSVRPDETVLSLLSEETKLGYRTSVPLANLSNKISVLRCRLRGLLKRYKEDGKKIAAFGAPTKATTLMSALGLGAEDFQYIVDDNTMKQGTVSPDTHIPVVSRAYMNSNPVDVLVLLAWNFAEPILDSLRDNESLKGMVVVTPLPMVKEEWL